MTDSGALPHPAPRRRWALIAGWALFAVAAAASLPYSFRYDGAPSEEGLMLTEAYLIGHGMVPYLSFDYTYGPGSIYIPAAWFLVFGSSLYSERALGDLYAAAFVAACAFLMRRVRKGLSLVGAFLALVYVDGMQPGLPLIWPSYLSLTASILEVTALDRIASPERATSRWLKLAPSGAAFLAVWSRHDFLVPVLLVALPYLPVISKHIRSLAGGFAGALALAYGSQALASGPHNLWYQLVINPIKKASGNWLPVPPPGDHLAAYLERGRLVLHFPWIAPAPPLAAQLQLMFFMALAFIATAGVLSTYSMMRGSPQGRLAASATLLALGQVPLMIQRDDAVHIAPALFCGLLAVIAASHAGAHLARVSLPARAAAPLAVVAVGFLAPSLTVGAAAGYVASGLGAHLSPAYLVSNEGHQFYLWDPGDARDLQKVLRVADSIAYPGMRLFVGNSDISFTPYSDVYLYYLLPQTRPGTYFVILYPEVAFGESSRYITDISRSDMLLLTGHYSGFLEPNASVRHGPESENALLARQFCLAASQGEYLLYLNSASIRDRPLARRWCKATQGHSGY